MLGYFDEDIQIARWAIVRSAFPFAADAQALAVRDARGNLDGERASLGRAALAFARRARLGDDLAGSLAARACARNREESLLKALLPASLTLRTRCRARAHRGA